MTKKQPNSKSAEDSYLTAERKLAVANINFEMTEALTMGIKKGWDFKELFNKCTKNHKKNAFKANGIHKLIFEKLCEDFHTEIKTEDSNFLALALGMIADQTGDKENAKTFMDVFVLPAHKSLIEKLEKEYPEALKDATIWE